MVAQVRSTDSNASQTFGMVLSGTVDPTVLPGFPAEKGSLYLEQTALLSAPRTWRKLDGAATAWELVGGGTWTVIGTRVAPILATAGTTIPFASTNALNLMFMDASVGPSQDMSATVPQIQAGTVLGQMLRIIFVAAIGTVKFSTGNGLNINGTIIGDANQALDMQWDGTTWFEMNRRS